jgi:ornithine decarboxylase
MKPKFIISKSTALEKYNQVKQLSDIVSYSSKTNQDVTKILEANSDTMFSVHFENELKHLKDLSRVIFLAQAWCEEEIKSLYERGIRWFVVDNETDLDVLVKYLEKNEIKQKINLLLRLKLKENTLRTEQYFVFGMNSSIIAKRIEQLYQHKNIESLGIHFHRKTQNMAEWNIAYELSNIFDEDTWNKIQYLNMGGGLPSEYANTNVNVIPGIIKKISELRDWLKLRDIKLIIEPGRFIAAPAVKLITIIKAIYENNIIVNASVYNSDMDAIIVPVKLKIENELSKEEGKPYVIKGITPCSLDLFRYRVYLKDPKVGDTITFLNAGAYNFTTDFCDLEKIESEIDEK